MTDDLISRQAAIDLFPNDTLYWDTNDGYIAPHFARRMIEELPSAQQWIPCSERLPDAGKIVLVCGKRGGIYTAIYSKSRANWNNGWWKLNSKSHSCDPEAWMPLPKPYEVEE